MEFTSSMTHQNTVSVEINATPERVFAALADVANHTGWAKGPEEIRNVSENPALLGTTFEQIGQLMGRTFVAECQVSDYEENRRFGFSGDKPFPFQISWELEPNSDGTRLTMGGQFEPGGLLKVAKPVLNSTLESQMKADLLTLKAKLEEEG
jgi:uncharacterized protein YndB with AHSA1/START domain